MADDRDTPTEGRLDIESGATDEEPSTEKTREAALGVTTMVGQQDHAISDVIERVRRYPPPESLAPSWVDLRIVRVWVSLPDVTKSIIHGLDAARGPGKLELIRAGVNRKHRSGWRSDSAVAHNLASLCRKSPVLWHNVAGLALRHYLFAGGISGAELPELGADPLDFYDKSDHAPEAVLLSAMALGVEEGILEILAGDCTALLGEIEVADSATAQQEQVKSVELESAELRGLVKRLEKEARVAQKREVSLDEEVNRLRAAQAEAGSVAEARRTEVEQELRQRAGEAETKLEDLAAEVERIPELEAQIQGLEDTAERLEAADAAAREERRLREQAEQDVARHLQRVRELTDQLGRATDSRNLPLDDAPELIAALARPIGQAARHAAERLASGRAEEHDHLMLELASTITRMSTQFEAEAPPAETIGQVETKESPTSEESRAPIEGEEVSEPGSQTTPQVLPDPTPPGLSGRRRRRPRLHIQPLGGAGEVGGSAILVRNLSGHTVLLDCGQRVRGEYGLETEPQFHHRIGQDGRLHGILISHSHIDHVGSLPILHREQSKSQEQPIFIYMTAPTKALAQIMLQDSAKIQQYRETSPGDMGFVDYGQGAMEAAYRQSDVARIFDDDFIKEVEPARIVPIPDTSFVARFLPVAHVLGSCAIHLTDTEYDQTLLYTGDLGPLSDPQITLPNYGLGEMLPADLVIMESTYGIPPDHEREGRRRRLSGREQAIQRLYDAASHAHENDGCVLLPAFSLGRTQELAKVIHQGRADGQLPEGGEIYIAGMGEKIIAEYARFSKGDNPWARADSIPRTQELGSRIKKGGLDFESAVGEVLGEGFSYVVASPAMLTSGWSRTFLENMVDDPRHAIILSGYMPKHAGGIPHLHRLAQGESINLAGEQKKILAKWQRAPALSAHAPSADLRQFAEYMTRQRDHVSFGMVHGDPAAQASLADDVDAMPGASAESLSKGQMWRPQLPA